MERKLSFCSRQFSLECVGEFSCTARAVLVNTVHMLPVTHEALFPGSILSLSLALLQDT